MLDNRIFKEIVTIWLSNFPFYFTSHDGGSNRLSLKDLSLVIALKMSHYQPMLSEICEGLLRPDKSGRWCSCIKYLFLYIFFSFSSFHCHSLLDNRISDLKRDELQSLTTSLKSLDLSGNSLTSVPEGIFWNLQRLETLNLARNNIIQIHSMAFQNGVTLYYYRLVLALYLVFDIAEQFS